MRGILACLCLITVAAAPMKPPVVELAPPVAKPPVPDETYGDWKVAVLANRSTIASVANNGGSTFGTVCDPRSCVAFFNPKIKCDSGAKYPALFNAPSAAYNATLTCEKVDDIFVYSMPLEGAVADAMSVGGVLGIAFPMASGQFQVSRFSLTGAARATARAAQLSRGTPPANKRQASDNQTL